MIGYRKNVDWDLGQGNPVLIVNHGHGSTGDLAYPERDTATFLSRIRLPITLGGIGTAYQAPGFGNQMLTVSSSAHTVTFNLFPGRAPYTPFQLDQQLNLLEERLLASGVTDCRVGTRVCLDGVWPFRKHSQAQAATFEATYPLAVQQHLSLTRAPNWGYQLRRGLVALGADDVAVLRAAMLPVPER